MYSYRHVLRQAALTALRNPILWVFGFLVTLIGNLGEIELALTGYGFGRPGALFSFWQGLAAGGLFSGAGFTGFFELLKKDPVYLFVALIILLIFLGISVALLWFAIVSQGALVSSIVAIAKGRELPARKAMATGITTFWPVLLINIAVRLAVFALFFIIGIVSLFTFTGILPVFIVVFDLLLMFVLIMSFVGRYAVCGVVLEGLSVRDAFKQSFHLFREHWLLNLEISAVLFLIYYASNSIILYFFAQIFVAALTIYAGFIFPLVLVMLILFLAFVGVQVWLMVFHWSVWTLVFELLTSKTVMIKSKLQRIFE